jgi:hypothetical protein
MSEIYLYDQTTYAVLFEFDGDISESRRGLTKWTDKPAEDGFNISDSGYSPPEKISVEGLITAWPMLSATNPIRVSQADAALRSLREKRQPVGLITRWWALEVVLDETEAKQGQGDGEKLTFRIECHPPRIATTAYTQIPAAKLKASVQKRGSPNPTKGGAAAGKQTPTSWLGAVIDFFS